jgi:chemotaxis protein methyltransferase CheR
MGGMNAPALRLEDENGPIERELLLRGIQLKYGYDFTHYAESSMRRRIDAVTRSLNLKNPIEVLNLVLRNRRVFEDVLPRLTIGVSEMFRDPPFFKSIREHAVPMLRTFPRPTIWCAGCSTGEEVFSLAILLKEEGLLDRSLIFATDVNPKALRTAKEGIYSTEDMKENTRNYLAAGGRDVFNHYYTADYGFVKMDASLLKNVVFSEHNLATDGVFTECQLVLCRNVLIYFDRFLQDRALKLFTESLSPRGFLGLGARENLKFTSFRDDFDLIDERWKLYQRSRERRRSNA